MSFLDAEDCKYWCIRRKTRISAFFTQMFVSVFGFRLFKNLLHDMDEIKMHLVLILDVFFFFSLSQEAGLFWFWRKYFMKEDDKSNGVFNVTMFPDDTNLYWQVVSHKPSFVSVKGNLEVRSIPYSLENKTKSLIRHDMWTKFVENK